MTSTNTSNQKIYDRSLEKILSLNMRVSLFVYISQLNYACRTSYCGMQVLYRLPATIRSSDTADFKNQLKAHFFWWTISFSFPFISIAGAIELDSMLRRLRNHHHHPGLFQTVHITLRKIKKHVYNKCRLYMQ